MSKETAPGQNKKATIYINTRPHEVLGPTISYEEISSLAFPGSNVKYSVSFSGGKGGHGGVVRPNQRVPVEDGMEFDVTPTDKS